MRYAFALLIGLLATPAFAAMQVRPLDWEVDGQPFSGHLVYDDAGGKRPGIVMVPNWRGVNATAIERAKAIGGRDYVVLVADVYGVSIRPSNNQEAAAAAQAAYADRERLRRRVSAALEQLRAQAGTTVPVDDGKLAAIGFCFGGATALELARSGADVAAVVSFHGNLTTPLPAQPGAVRAKVLVLNGADDSYVKPEHIAGFQVEMTAAGADWQLVNLSGAVHCFAEPDANEAPGCLYHERSAKRAYRMMRAHLAEAFGD